jgi:hypothetical protein
MIGLLLDLIILCAIIGVAWYAMNAIPMPPPFRVIIIVVICIIVILFLASLLQGTGGLGGFGGLRLGRP